MLFYQPAENVFVADVWCLRKRGLWYIYGCQPDGIGVATSPDLVDYSYRGIAIPGFWYGGDTFLWKGGYHMVYSHPGTDGNVIHLAHSKDLIHWTNHPGNPILSFPDPRWYDGRTYRSSLREISNCRDPSVIKDAFTNEWAYLCFAGDTGRGDLYRRACIGLARSRDLVRWEYLPPLFAPGTSTLMEVPRVCRIGTRWFLTWLAAPWYGMRSNEDTPRRPSGPGETMIHYAVADHPLGPYRLPGNPTLFQGQFSPYVIDFARAGRRVKVVCSMFRQKGERHDAAERGGVLPAMPVRQARSNPRQLEVLFPDELRAQFKRRPALVNPLRTNDPWYPPLDVRKHGRTIVFTRTSNRIVELTGPTNAELIVDVDYRVNRGRAGIMTRYADRCGCGVLVDPRRKELQFVEVVPKFKRAVLFRALERHTITTRVGRAFKLSVIQARDYQLVFVNGLLAATFSFARRERGKAALLLENATGRCVVGGIAARTMPRSKTGAAVAEGNRS